VETNRDSAVQIEVVGRAAAPKSRGALENVARLCRWIEKTHQVATEWPNGFPTPPGSVHNRNSEAWNQRSGHFGHCHVPENTHEDPGYSTEEVGIVMGHTPVAVFVRGNPVAQAEGFLEDNTAWAAARPVVEAMGGGVDPADDQISVIVSFRGQTIKARARGVASGTAFVPLRELRRLNGVVVDFTEAEAARVDISLPAA
jgi:hypothetical protein